MASRAKKKRGPSRKTRRAPAKRPAPVRKASRKPGRAKTTAAAFVIAPPPLPSLPIAGSRARFPVARVFCVGRNYAEHVREMGYDPNREVPFFFTKDPGALVLDGGVFPYPPLSSDVHHEVELVVAMKTGGSDISPEKALTHVYGYGAGVDMTRRDLQGEAKKTGRPWEVGKAFEKAALCSRLRPASEIGHPSRGRVWLDVNGQNRQSGDLAQMVWKVPEIIAHLSRLFVIRPGDLIFTGTPAGVGPVKKGDVMTGGVDGVATLQVTVG